MAATRYAGIGTSHGHCLRSNTSCEYDAWKSMLARCRNKNLRDYPRYGGRGITVCARWHEFANFLADMGLRPSSDHSLDRIDNNGNYEPDNCRWATRKVQLSNKRTNVVLEFYGKSMTVTQWAEISLIPAGTIFNRIKRGWSSRRAVWEPLHNTATKQHYAKS